MFNFSSFFFMVEHVVNYANLNEPDALASTSEQSTSNMGLAPKFIDTINPLMKFSNDDLVAMNDDVNDLIESDSSDDDDEDDDGSNDVDLGRESTDLRNILFIC